MNLPTQTNEPAVCVYLCACVCVCMCVIKIYADGKRNFYTTHNVTSLLLPGANAAGLMVGPGWAGINGPGSARNNSNSQVIAQIHLHYNDGTSDIVVTDASWQSAPSPVVTSSVYNGETYDARLEQPGWSTAAFSPVAGSWPNAQISAPVRRTALSSQAQPPIRVIERFEAKSVVSPSPNVYVYDFGQNLAGWVRIKLPPGLPAGTNVTLRHAELLMHPPYGPDDGSIYVANLRTAKATDCYIVRGDDLTQGEEYEPRFTYHGFRYLELSGLSAPLPVEDVVSHFVHTDVGRRGALSTSSALLDAEHHNFVYGALSNLVGYPSDCDQRDERQGWMGDAALASELEVMNFDMGGLYNVWVQSIVDELKPDGGATNVVPGQHESPDPAWSTAFPTIAYNMLRYYNDTAFVARIWPQLKHYAQWLESKYKSAGSSFAQYFTRYGDWCAAGPTCTGEIGNLVSAGTYLTDLQHYQEMAAAVGDGDAKRLYAALFKDHAANFNSVFFNASTNSYLEGCQTSLAIPLWLQIVPEASQAGVIGALADDIVNKNGIHPTVGIIGLRYLLEALANVGRTDLAVSLLEQTTYPSFGYQIYNKYEPATTVWELWDSDTTGPNMNSRNHVSFILFFNTVDVAVIMFLALRARACECVCVCCCHCLPLQP